VLVLAQTADVIDRRVRFSLACHCFVRIWYFPPCPGVNRTNRDMSGGPRDGRYCDPRTRLRSLARSRHFSGTEFTLARREGPSVRRIAGLGGTLRGDRARGSSPARACP
jgi:hypothetical protein